MGLFDSIFRGAGQAGNIANQASGFMNQAANTVRQAAGNKSVNVVFDRLPNTLEDFKRLPQAALSNPFDTAAMTVLAFCFYPQNPELSLSMLNELRGPRPLSGGDMQFIRDRFRDKDYVPRSYFKGSVPANDYTPQTPYTVNVSENPYSYQTENYAMLYVHSGGADSPRGIQLRKAKDGKWYLWEQYILADIRKPESENPWA